MPIKLYSFVRKKCEFKIVKKYFIFGVLLHFVDLDEDDDDDVRTKSQNIIFNWRLFLAFGWWFPLFCGFWHIVYFSLVFRRFHACRTEWYPRFGCRTQWTGTITEPPKNSKYKLIKIYYASLVFIVFVVVVVVCVISFLIYLFIYVLFCCLRAN